MVFVGGTVLGCEHRFHQRGEVAGEGGDVGFVDPATLLLKGRLHVPPQRQGQQNEVWHPHAAQHAADVLPSPLGEDLPHGGLIDGVEALARDILQALRTTHPHQESHLRDAW